MSGFLLCDRCDSPHLCAVQGRCAGPAEDDDWGNDRPECPRCDGDGMDPFNDYLIECPRCGGISP